MAGKAGISPLWVFAPGAAACLLAPYARRLGWRAGWSFACLLFLCAGFYLGHARAADWSGRGGPAGEVWLEGEVCVGCRGDRGDVLDIFEVTVVCGGEAAMPGDRYLLRARDDDSGALQWGDRLRVRGPLFIFAEERGGIGGSVVAEEVEVLSHTSNPLIRAALGYRRVMREQTEALPDEASAALIQGMALGDYRLLRARDLKDFRVTGLIHLCAASGLHLAILAGFVVWLGRRARLPPRLVLAAQAPILITYALAVGLSVPVTRATVVALLAAAAYLLGRDFDLLPATGAAVIILVWNDPGAAAGVSFQLCFAAAMGIALLHRPVRALMGAGRSKALDLLAVTAAAQLAVGPIILHHFGEVSLLAPLSNLLVLPLVPAVMGLSMLSSLFGTAGLPLAGAFMRAAAFLSRGILTVARTLASQGWATLRIFPLSPLWLAAYYPVLVLALMGKGRWRRAGRVVLALLLAAALFSGLDLKSGSLGADTGARITFIDVGQGDAVLLQLSSGTTVLVDGGLEERVLTTDLRSRGVRFIDAVVVSHPDADHIGGLEGALDDCEVGMLVHPATGNAGKAGMLLSLAEEMGVDVRTMRAGDSIALGEMTLKACSPPREIPEGASVNEYSLVLRADAPGFSMLLAGDVGEEGERMLLENADDLRCDILKVPHHGGFCAESEEFFSRVDPAIAVISVGAENPYGHPSSETIGDLRRIGCAVYRTDRHGDIVIRVVQGGYRVECERR